MSSWEKWQAAQGAPPPQAPPVAFNQNNHPIDNGTLSMITTAAAPAPAQSAPGGGSATNPSNQQQTSKTAPAAAAAVTTRDGTRILSADEVKKELSAMDPETRQKTIEMGNKLKDLVQAAIDIYTATPNLSSSLLKEKILEKVGPMPVKEIDLPVHALKVLYAKLYGKNAPPEHEAPLQALSKVFSPAQQQQQQGIVGGAGGQHQDKILLPNAAAAANSKPLGLPTVAPAGSSAIGSIGGIGPGGKKLGVSREQYEKLLSRMNPEERKKHPKYDQVMKQYEQMDVSEKQRTQEAANKLRDFMKHSVQLYLGNPALSLESYRRRMIDKFGPVPNYSQWHLVTYTHLCTMYETINNVSHQTPHVMAALRALSQILPRPPPGTTPAAAGAAGNAPQAAAGAAKPAPPPPPRVTALAARTTVQQHIDNYQQRLNSPQSTAHYTHEQLEEMELAGIVMGKYEEPDYNNLPEDLNVSCNGHDGIFFVRTQTIRCLCDFCAETAESLKVPFLNISVNEFERHCGMGQSKKWKYTIRVMDPPVMTLGQWMDENGFNIKYTKGQPDDIKLKRAEKKRDKEAAALRVGHRITDNDGADHAPGGGGFNLNNQSEQGQHQHQQQQGLAHQVSTARALPAAPAPAATAAAPAPPPVNRRKALLKSAAAANAAGGYHQSGDEGADLERPGTAGGGGVGRGQRQRKQPTWMKQTVDPNAVLGGKSMVQRQNSEFDDDEDDIQILRGAGALYPPRNRPPSAHYTGEGSRGGVKRPRIDPDMLLEAEIDAALSRGLQPEVHGWRVDDSNQLNVTVHLGGVVFSGVLPARVPREASSPAIMQAVLRDQHVPNAALAAPAAVVAPISRPPLPLPQRNVVSASAFDSDVDMDDLPPVPPTAARTISSALGIDPTVLPGSATVAAAAAAAAAASVPVGGAAAVVIESAVNKAVKKELRMDERRADAAAEYDRLLVDGPPAGTKCAMCHLEEVDTVPRGSRDPSTGKSQVGLGGLILVRTSAVTNAWVHDQCARWSPDVYDPTGEGILEGIAVAVRRGRMLRCKTCGEKGATLGCLKKTCKSSYHLPCARQHGCLLNMEPYAVACPEHVEQLPDGLSQKLGFRGRKRARSESVPAPPVAFSGGGGGNGIGGGGVSGGSDASGGGGGVVQSGFARSLDTLKSLAATMHQPPPPSNHYMHLPPPPQ